MQKPLEPGIHLLHKPVGPSSFAALREVQPSKLRSCHGGTLDPFASGLLLILVEPATQLFDLLHDVPKVYDVVIRWGTETANGDPTGKVVASGQCEHLTPATIATALEQFIGWHDQIPPATSAKRVAGERAYELAHRGETVVLPPASVYLHSAQWIDHDLPRTSRLCVTVRGGFYIRALVRDLGRKLNSAAHIDSLHRVSIGPYSDPPPGKVIAAPVLPWLPTRELNVEEVKDLKAGRLISIGQLTQPTWSPPPTFPAGPAYVRGTHQGRLSFILEPDAEALKKNRLLRGGLNASLPASA